MIKTADDGITNVPTPAHVTSDQAPVDRHSMVPPPVRPPAHVANATLSNNVRLNSSEAPGIVGTPQSVSEEVVN